MPYDTADKFEDHADTIRDSNDIRISLLHICQIHCIGQLILNDDRTIDIKSREVIISLNLLEHDLV